MRDIVLYAHIIIGVAIIVIAIMILLEIKNKKKGGLIKPLSILAGVLSWIVLIPSAILYLIFYPATKTLVKSGSWPWAHSIVMETKEHWGMFLPIIATIAAIMVFSGKIKESKKWWILLIIIATLIAISGRVIKIGAVS